jgi:hypothetical protein
MICHLDIMTGDSGRTPMLSPLIRNFSTTVEGNKSYYIHVGVLTTGISDTVVWDVDFHTYWRTDCCNIHLMFI